MDDKLKIIGVEIKNLFSTKNYEIDFNQDSDVTVIYGLNGTGKTTILRMIHDILSLNFNDLEKNNFKSFILKLKSNSYIEYIKKKSIEDSEIIKYSKKKKSEPIWKPFSMKAIEGITRYYRKKQYDFISLYNYFIKTNLSNKIIQMYDNDEDDEIIDFLFRLNETDQQFEFLTEGVPIPIIFQLLELFFKKKFSPIPKWFNDIVNSNPLLYIKSERLTQYNKLIERRRTRYEFEIPEEKLIRVISKFSEELKRLKTKNINTFNEISQTLNRTFPKRVVDILKSTNRKLSSTPELEKQIKKIRNKENELISFGLLTKKQQEIPEIEVESLQVSEIAKSISLWIDDTNDKHAEFDILLGKLKLFKDLINKHLLEKEIKFDSEGGYYFFTDSHERLSGENLSSGEQHIIVLFFQIIFLAKENSLVLIDEPEISLHTIWQNSFIDDIFKMGKNKSLSFILATHSSAIINGRFSLMRKLE